MKSTRLSQAFYQEIRTLLEGIRPPRVSVSRSGIVSDTDVGEGVFVTSQDTIHHPPSVPLCLYPGVYTPGLPPLLAMADDDSMITYLGNTVPPSGIDNDHNAYILNIPEVGGYLDGLALSPSSSLSAPAPPDNTTPPDDGSLLDNSNNDDNKNGDQFNSQRRMLLDENPSACGHKVNHSTRRANVSVIPFFWKDVFPENEPKDGFKTSYLPNILRNDGSPWYHDGYNNTIRYFSAASAQEKIIVQPQQHSSFLLCCGAAICSLRTLQPGEEIFLDYGLRRPYPSWARDWYSTAV